MSKDRKQWIGTRRRLTTSAMALGLALAPEAQAQEATGDGRARAAIVGLVVDERNQPIANATVSLPSLRRGTTTNDSGKFLIRDLPSSEHVLEARRLGYQSAVRRVDLGAGGQVSLTLLMSRSPVTVAEVVVTGRAGASERRGAQDVAALGEASLRATSTGSIGKTLEKLPGVSNMGGGPGGGNPVLRGLSQGRVRIVRDGVPQENFEASPRWFPPGNLSSTDRIEVIRGPASILYGSNALGGAINIVPRSLPSSGPDGFRLYGLAEGQYFTNNNEYYRHGELAAAVGSVGMRAGAARRVAGNFRTPDVAPFSVSKVQGAPKFAGPVEFTNFEQTSRYGQAGVAKSWGTLRAMYDGWEGSNNFANASGKPAGVRSRSDDVRLQGIFVTGWSVLKPTVAVQTVGIKRAATAAKTFAAAADSNLWDQNLTNQVVTVRLEVEHPVIAGFRGTLGAEYGGQHSVTKLSQIQPSGDVDNVAVFALEEYRFDRLTLSAGGRFDARHQIAAAGSLVNAKPAEERAAALDRRMNVFTGSVGGTYQASDVVSISVNVSSGFRAPNFIDLYTNENRPALGGWLEGNPTAEPERSTSMEAGIHYATPRLGGGIVGYRNAFNNFTYLNRSSRTRVVNGATVPVFGTQQTAGRLAGIEVNGAGELFPAVVLDASYAKIVSRNLSTGEALPLMPADQLRASLRYAPRALAGLTSPYAQIGAKHAWFKGVAGPTEPFADGGSQGFGVASTPAYTVFDVGVGAHVVVGSSELELNLSVENLFDTAFSDFLDTQKGFTLGAGRNVALRVSVPFLLRR